MDTEEYEVLPLKDIPVEIEEPEDIVHDGVQPCGDPGCPCWKFGYGVAGLHEAWEPLP